MGVATATTLLSALWPGDHIILDIRALGALIGVTGISGKGWYAARVGEGSETRKGLDSIDWNDYAWYRAVILAESRALNTFPVNVERALFVLDEKYSRGRRRRDNDRSRGTNTGRDCSSSPMKPPRDCV